MAPKDPVGAADDTVLVRQTIRAVGHNHGLRTSFSPSVVAGHVGNGGHVHVSAWRDGKNLFAGGPGPHGITAEAEAFSAGILRELPALLVIGTPSVASYQRLVPQHWAGAFQTWGLENRETALRLVTGTSGHEARSANLEVKCFDLSANPYLVVGSLLAAGQAGIRDELQLPPEVRVDPSGLSEEELAAVGGARLPASLQEALEAYEAARCWPKPWASPCTRPWRQSGAQRSPSSPAPARTTCPSRPGGVTDGRRVRCAGGGSRPVDRPSRAQRRERRQRSTRL